MQRFSLYLFCTAWYAAASTSFAMEIIAHRGASHDAPENTLAAFKLAWEQKADAVELDIWLTKDGKIVCLHDDNTKRIAGRDHKVADQMLAELRVLDAGKWKSRQWVGEKIPTLDEALATIPNGKRLFIEIKCGPEMLPELERVFNASGKKPQQLVIIAFSFTVASLVKAKFPAIEVSWLYNWKKDTGDKFTRDQLITKAREAKLDGLDVQFKGPIDAAFVTKVKSAGLKLYVWTVDQPVTAKQLMAAGVDGITTNRPEWLRQKLAE
jgi:glycerophosphoryl diester phosphodiesterase